MVVSEETVTFAENLRKLMLEFIKKLFGKRSKETVNHAVSGDKKHQMPLHPLGDMDYADYENRLLAYYKQEWAIRDNASYFEPQDNMFGEMFDNAMRIRMLKEGYPELFAQVPSNLRLLIRAREEYLKDKEDQA